MSIEIEAKMQLGDLPAMERRLAELRAEQGPVVRETNTYFDTPGATLKASDQGLRLRVEAEEGKGLGDSGGPLVVITHKGPRAHGRLKSRSETELVVSDARAAAGLLGALGFQPAFSFEKRRHKWELDQCHVALDQLPYLGDFIEIEGPSDEAVLAVRDKLGLSAAPLIHASYISMLASYVEEHRITAQHIGFENE